LNILTIANAFGDKDVSGVDVVVKSYAKELIDKGHHVNVLARTRRFFDKTVKIAWKILRAKGDIYHCHYLLQDCWLALRSGKRPIVGHAHDSDLREVIRSRKWGWMVKRNLESCDKILVLLLIFSILHL